MLFVAVALTELEDLVDLVTVGRVELLDLALLLDVCLTDEDALLLEVCLAEELDLTCDELAFALEVCLTDELDLVLFACELVLTLDVCVDVCLTELVLVVLALTDSVETTITLWAPAVEAAAFAFECFVAVELLVDLLSSLRSVIRRMPNALSLSLSPP